MAMSMSCQTYNNKISSYYNHLSTGEFDAAGKALDNNRFLRLKRNRLLYQMEKGKVAFLRGDYQQSNNCLNAADSLLESHFNAALDQGIGLLLNPAMQQYRGEDFEKLLIHYYKSLNYLQLRQHEDAVVEARRITLKNDALNDRKNNNDRKYANDAFALMLQGMIYESVHNINDAFISYRNAADIFLKTTDTAYYGVKMPAQLQQDLLHMAYLNGFGTELSYYEKQFNTTYTPPKKEEGGDLILFWENGLAPVKTENNFFFTLTKNGLGSVGFTNEETNLFIPFDFRLFPKENAGKLGYMETFRVAFPKYMEQPLYYTNASISANAAPAVPLEKIEDVNQLAFRTLQERFIKEMSLALTRLAIKKLAEHQLKKENETAAQVFDGLAFLTEKADTRNWQSLPHAIYYVRIPLKKGRNDISLQLSNVHGQTNTVKLQVEGNGMLQARHYSSLQRG
ncbi:hypothetical protein ECE50_014760 [Chitinophaga sp. Mgbs1]|uniref:Uncharacterized protein n=1 Tax=Chitinophaga solisilvae TaxID=1233460 RepID=A0A433WKB3_9BACT|nr:hypothetical protein [Chitinophaga solisilvae]